MALVREWQDRVLRGTAEGATTPDGGPMGHYKAFISWPFQRDNTPLGRVKEWGDTASLHDKRRAGERDEPFPGDVVANLSGDGDPRAHREFGRRLRMAGSTAYLRTQALSRLMLDNVYSIGSSWVTRGPHIGQLGLFYGANDMGSVMMEENVVSSAGTTFCLNEPVLCRLIRDAGFIPAQRDNVYDIIDVKDGPDAPDLAVEDWSEHRVQKLTKQVEQEPREEARVSLSVSAKDSEAVS